MQNNVELLIFCIKKETTCLLFHAYSYSTQIDFKGKIQTCTLSKYYNFQNHIEEVLFHRIPAHQGPYSSLLRHIGYTILPITHTHTSFF